MMGKARQLREMRRAVIAKNQSVVIALAVIAVVERDEGAIFDDHRFVDFQ